jgi:hypothetical protein
MVHFLNRDEAKRCGVQEVSQSQVKWTVAWLPY